jgi:hypothetical protein
MTDSNFVERRGAQALLATYLQLTRSAGLAQQLHQARKRAMERRIQKSTDDLEQLRLRQRLEAQETQGETIDGALYRLQSRVSELSSFAEAGLTMQDFREFGLHDVVDAEAVEAARLRREARGGEMREDAREDGQGETRESERDAREVSAPRGDEES